MDQHGSKQGVWPCHASWSCGQRSKTWTRGLYNQKGLVANFVQPHWDSTWRSLETGHKCLSLALSCSIVFFPWFEWRHSRRAHQIYGGAGAGIKTEEIVAIFGVRIRIQMVFTVQVSRSNPAPYDLRVTVCVFNIRKSQLCECRELNWWQLNQKRMEGVNEPQAQCDPTMELLFFKIMI